ncbi:Uma2 family endonuclease [Cyanobacterium sp. Dongsha4]|uniref:Uma2 family endonuclease n=1 Tax=Cyanobacterium sp. DS4 TaxID=2878255 RepID=UPI002E81A14C|nr:Uma2 family endonuclease [Cyanobacterium sp. Dongsha4]WVK99576.1 Uma2 family endonuclease [Cyanobacterium sp. Dongsha4]
MTILLETPQPQSNKLFLHGITWNQLKNLESSFNDIAGVRLIYLDSILEIMILGTEHEYYKRTISLLLDAYLRAKNIRFYSGGSATLGTKEITGRKEPDESYNIHSKKEIPDLVIEIIITSGDINILEIYRRLAIPEVWFWQNKVLTVYTLKNNQYIKVNESNLLPDLNLESFTKYINYHDQYDAVNEFISELK